MPTDSSNTAPAHRRTDLTLVVAFLGLIAAVPISQTALDLRRGERVQFTDVLRDTPTSANLRRFEETLKARSWVQRAFRPVVQRFLFRTFGEAGSKAIAGRDDWLFYRPDVRFLVEGNRTDRSDADSRWVVPGASVTQRESVRRAIRRFRDQLARRGIELLVVPVPGKPSVYPDQLTIRAGEGGDPIPSSARELLVELEADGVATVDLFSVFRRARAQAPAATLYLARDTHWTPRAARLAAEAVADHLRELGWAPLPEAAFGLGTVNVDRWGDILEMMQLPGLRAAFGPERVACEQVLDPALGLLVPGASERPGVYRYPIRPSPVLLLGDSFCRIYQYAEPQSLGNVVGEADPAVPGSAGRQSTKRLLPGSAGFVSHLARALRAPVDAIVSDGGASTDVRRKLSTHPEILEGKRVVVWQFVERDIGLGRAGWADVPLPVELGKGLEP